MALAVPPSFASVHTPAHSPGTLLRLNARINTLRPGNGGVSGGYY
jgi:hypothetical protein